MKFVIWMRALAVVCLVLATELASAVEEDVEALFRRANESLRDANAVYANVLAPSSYADAIAVFRAARTEMEKGAATEQVRNALDEADRKLRETAKIATDAQTLMADAVRGRGNAIEAKAEEHSKEKWQEAEQMLVDAAFKLEDGKESAARKLAADAAQIYNDAELEAIKANYLKEGHELLERAKREKIGRRAPRTLAHAESLLKEAEAAILADRYDVDRPRSLARDATQELRHAFVIAERLAAVADKDMSLEQLVLEMEKPFNQLAELLDVSLVREDPRDLSAPLVTEIERLQAAALELQDTQREVRELNAMIGELELRLGMQSERLERQEQHREKFEQVQAMFSPEEADVLKYGDDIVVRLIGLKFSPGSAVVEPRFDVLLAKVQAAMDQYPDAPIVVEGHTDSFGSDSTNLALSDKRAAAVRVNLLRDREAQHERVVAQGFGESRPIANNETEAGREKNRRIDLIIKIRD